MGFNSISPLVSLTPAAMATIGSSAVEVKAGNVRIPGRKGLYIKNTSSVVLKWGPATDQCIYPLAAESAAGKGDGGDIWIDVGDAQGIFIIAVSGSGQTAAIGEFK